jgi:NAD(P)-dependent dehydrogenase (short-subunit alcohol dehydrogenase family)
MKDLFTFNEGYKKALDLGIEGMTAGPMKVAGIKKATPMKDILSLEGKVAIVTGGAMGLGLNVVNRLVEAGARVVIADIAVEYAEKALEYFSTTPYKVKFVKCDVRYPDQIKAAVDFTVKEFGGIDILVNNAAIWALNSILEIGEERWDDSIDTNLKGPVFFIQAVVDCMVKQGRGGKIVNIASVAGVNAEHVIGHMVQYVASKAGVIAISQSLAKELKPLGININCVIPGGMLSAGAVNTIMSEGTKQARAKRDMRIPTDDPDLVARAVYILTTGVSDYMHGATVAVDGGARWMCE